MMNPGVESNPPNAGKKPGAIQEIDHRQMRNE